MKAMAVPHPLCHEPSGEECTLGHLEGGACQVCKHCRDKVRPKNMGEACPARQKEGYVT